MTVDANPYTPVRRDPQGPPTLGQISKLRQFGKINGAPEDKDLQDAILLVLQAALARGWTYSHASNTIAECIVAEDDKRLVKLEARKAKILARRAATQDA